MGKPSCGWLVWWTWYCYLLGYLFCLWSECLGHYKMNCSSICLFVQCGHFESSCGFWSVNTCHQLSTTKVQRNMIPYRIYLDFQSELHDNVTWSTWYWSTCICLNTTEISEYYYYEKLVILGLINTPIVARIYHVRWLPNCPNSNKNGRQVRKIQAYTKQWMMMRD